LQVLRENRNRSALSVMPGAFGAANVWFWKVAGTTWVCALIAAVFAVM
jgi:hypothetical protein